MGRPDVAVGVDGSLYRFHPHFHDLMVQKIQELVEPGIKVLVFCFHFQEHVMQFGCHIYLCLSVHTFSQRTLV